MIGKLCRFELRTSIRQISIVWGALLASSVLLAVVGGVSNKINYSSMFSNLLTGLASIIYGAVLITMIVLAIVIVVLRFYNSMCGNEGYLIHTLPVSTRSIILSKGIVATLILSISAIVALVSILVISIGITGTDITGMFGLLGDKVARDPKIVFFVFELAVVVIFGILKSIYNVYAAVSIGQIFNRHRVMISVFAYIAINVVLSFILIALLMLTELSSVDHFMLSVGIYLEKHFTEWGFMQLSVIFMLGVELVQILVFHIITEMILSRRLNLL
ncbi:MAG: hypothetical protein ACI4KJ_00900 [Anaerovoracaceae bacterium]